VVCYSMGMTMTRNELTKALADVKPQADGYTLVEFASPKLLMMARADRGHYRMTPAEFREYRMDRGVMHEGRLESAIEFRRNLHRTQRVVAARILAGPGRRRARVERRVTGLQPGTKRPTSWTSHEVEREVRRVR
jgi:hypothetical protein